MCGTEEERNGEGHGGNLMQCSVLCLLLLRQLVIDADLERGGRLHWLHDNWHVGGELEQPLVQELEVWHEVGSAIPRNRSAKASDRGPVDREPKTCINTIIECAHYNKAVC